MRPRQLRRRLVLMAYGAILAGAAIGFTAAPAKALPIPPLTGPGGCAGVFG